MRFAKRDWAALGPEVNKQYIQNVTEGLCVCVCARVHTCGSVCVRKCMSACVCLCHSHSRVHPKAALSMFVFHLCCLF